MEEVFDSSIVVQVGEFDGPLSLLLTLVQKEKMNIYELNLKLITEQYLKYLKKMEELDFNVAGDYLYLAATLIYLKSKGRLTEHEERSIKEDLDGQVPLRILSQEDLMDRLEQLQSFQAKGRLLGMLPQRGREVFVRPRRAQGGGMPVVSQRADLEELVLAMIQILSLEVLGRKTLRKRPFSVKETLKSFASLLKKGMSTTFQELLSCQKDRSRANMVASFISLLELAKLQKIEVYQSEGVGKIYFEVKEDL